MAWMMIGNDLANTTHHLGSQSETQIMISLTAFLHRSFRMQQEQVDIYYSPALLEVAWSVGEENVTTHLAIILQELSGKERLIFITRLGGQGWKELWRAEKVFDLWKVRQLPKGCLENNKLRQRCVTGEKVKCVLPVELLLHGSVKELVKQIQD